MKTSLILVAKGIRYKYDLPTALRIMQKMIRNKETLPITNKSKLYFNKTRNNIERTKNYTILKDNEFDDFGLDSGATRTLVGENPFMCHKNEYKLDINL